ncbi:MAG: ATP-binding protein [Kiritimatiellae bacterium]|nr:ATP-binding protein [Kiritimatiellia bacterium]
MKFYGREAELAELARIRKLSMESSRFTVVTGRRRVGKTELIEKAFNDGNTPYLYFLVTQRAEKDLCEVLQEAAQEVLARPILGAAMRFSQLFEAVMSYAVDVPMTLVIDEFQELDRINPAIFGEMQGVWDRLHRRAKLNLVVCGSVNRLMGKIFFDDSQPLYGRNTGRLDVLPFTTALLKEILVDHRENFARRDLLALWTLTGGVARYVEMFMDAHAYTRKAMLDTVFGLSSAYMDEGRVILSDEFGRDYGVYFSILSAIAAGRTSFAEIRNIVGEEIGGHLTKLERAYAFITKRQPFREKTQTRNCLYQIDDCFIRFWFRFVYKYFHLIEQRQLHILRQIVERDFDVFSGFALERYFRAKFIEENRYTRIGGWWDRKGENEIDLVCENERNGVLDFVEVKIDAKRIDLRSLAMKTVAFFKKNPDMNRGVLGLKGVSLADM